MNDQQTVEFDDIQALARFAHGHLQDSCFLLLSVIDRHAAGRWLQRANIATAGQKAELPDTAVQIAFTPAGLTALGLPEQTLMQFPEDYLTGISGDESRSRRLGDVDHNAPALWQWGHHDWHAVHLLLLLYSHRGSIGRFREEIADKGFDSAFHVCHTLPTDTLSPHEPFGFKDGISQPRIDWQHTQRTDVHAREAYSNLLAPGEIVLGYDNEYGQLTPRPLVRTTSDTHSVILPPAVDHPGYQDMGRNGTYLVLRQLQQDVSGFWKYVHEQARGNATLAEELATQFVGRQRDGKPLVIPTVRNIPGISRKQTDNHFDYDDDPYGFQCPVGAHIRRSNPRSGDFPPGVSGFWSRLVSTLGFNRQAEQQDLVASSRFHRLLRRGRTYGAIHPQSAETDKEQGLQFISLGANITRQFEFVQSAWSISSSFAGTREERDPLLGHRRALDNGTRTDNFMQADVAGAQRKLPSLPAFVTVRGAGYFFMPGLRAVRYLGKMAEQNPDGATPNGDEPDSAVISEINSSSSVAGRP